MFQQNWLTPMSLGTFEKHFDSYFAFGSSAMGVLSLVYCVADRLVVLRLLLIKTYVEILQLFIMMSVLLLMYLTICLLMYVFHVRARPTD